MCLLRLNIFVEFEGYWALCYGFEITDLRQRSRQQLLAWLSLSDPPEATSDRERFWLRAYGAGVFLSEIVLNGILILGGTWLLIHELAGVGALLAVVLLGCWYHETIGSWFMSFAVVRWFVRGGRFKTGGETCGAAAVAENYGREN